MFAFFIIKHLKRKIKNNLKFFTEILLTTCISMLKYRKFEN